MRIYTASAIVVFSAIMLATTVCGGESSPTPNIDATVEEKVQVELTTEASTVAQAKERLVKTIPTAIALPTPIPTPLPTSTPVPPTSAPVPAAHSPLPTTTATPVPLTATATVTSAAPPAQVPDTPVPTESPGSKTIDCSLGEDQRTVSCEASEGLSGEWSSNASTRTLGGNTFEFTVDLEVPQIVVELKACVNDDCSTLTAFIEPPPTRPFETNRKDEAGERNAQIEKQEAPFWNEPMWPISQMCTGSFQFTHMIVDVADVDSIGVSPGGHIAPHDHMAYWGTGDIENQPQKSGDEKQSSEKVQLFSPADIFFISLGTNNKEWGGTLFTCDGHGILLGHVSDPSDELNLIFPQNEPEPGCDDNSCSWRFPTFIPAGTPLFKSSGYTSGFDFGLMLVGLTAEELQKQPGYGYSITPWRTGGSGNSVCPLEYFEEPLRSEYTKFLGDFTCGPFNQDVPGTAMGFWLDTPSTEIYPGIAFKDEWDVDEWKTIWLFQDFRKTASSNYNITVGNNIFGLDHGPHGEYSYIASESGSVNRAWDDIRPGKNYCIELRVKENMFVVDEDVQKILIIKVSDDGNQLTVEALDNNECGDGPWVFQGGEWSFYR